MKKLFSLVIALFLAIGISGCGGNTGSTAPADAPTIGFSISTLSNPFFVSMRDAAQQKANELGVNLLVLDASDQPAQQINDIENLVNQGVKAIVINPTDSDAVASAVQAAIDAGIPVISVDRSVTGVNVASHIASDNVAGGRLAGEFIADKLGGHGNVIELEGIPGASAAIERGRGFEEAVAGKLDIIAKQPANFERAMGLSVMENLAQAHSGNFQAVFAQNDEMILGALPALQNIEGIITVGFDGGTEAFEAIRDGRLSATVAQQPDVMGQLGVENALKLINGESIQASIPAETVLVNADNVAQFLD